MSLIARAVWRKSRVGTMLNWCGRSLCSMSRTALRPGSNVTVRKWRLRPRTVTFIVSSSDLHLHLADFIFDISVERMLAEAAQVRVSGQPFEIAVPQRQSAVQSGRRQVKFAVERIAA